MLQNGFNNAITFGKSAIGKLIPSLLHDDKAKYAVVDHKAYVYAGLIGMCYSTKNDDQCEIELIARFVNEKHFHELELEKFRSCISDFDEALEQNAQHIQRLQEHRLNVTQILGFDFSDYICISDALKCNSTLVNQLPSKSWTHHIDLTQGWTDDTEIDIGYV